MSASRGLADVQAGGDLSPYSQKRSSVHISILGNRKVKGGSQGDRGSPENGHGNVHFPVLRNNSDRKYGARDRNAKIVKDRKIPLDDDDFAKKGEDRGTQHRGEIPMMDGREVLTPV